MNCKVETYPLFDRVLKKLGKRYRSIKEDVARLIGELEQNPTMGTDLGDGLRKIRLTITSKGRGKSGGARVITFTLILAQEEAEVALLFIYDKADRENMTGKELEELRKASGL